MHCSFAWLIAVVEERIAVAASCDDWHHSLMAGIPESLPIERPAGLQLRKDYNAAA